jgi:cyclophilin family peptidyl-prolyl cis-trans isomerase
MRRVFLEISVGSRSIYEKELEEYQKTLLFLQKIHVSYCWPDVPEELDSEQREILIKMFGDSNARFIKPVNIVKGRLLIELFDQETPKTVENFLKLCTGSAGLSKSSKKPLHYKNVPMHRIVRDFICQGGDVTRFDGSGGDSIYGGKFKDEKAGLKMEYRKGYVGMANSGKNSNTSQFFVCLSDSAADKLNGKYVCFGRVVEGLEILDLINQVEGEPVLVSDCGIVE